MRLPGPRSYPKELVLNDQVYKVKFVRKFKHTDTMGECDPGDYEIRIKLGLSREETLKTFIHEVLHLVEFEGPLDIKHSLIYKLEEQLYNLLVNNF